MGLSPTSGWCPWAGVLPPPGRLELFRRFDRIHAVHRFEDRWIIEMSQLQRREKRPQGQAAWGRAVVPPLEIAEPLCCGEFAERPPAPSNRPKLERSECGSKPSASAYPKTTELTLQSINRRGVGLRHDRAARHRSTGNRQQYSPLSTGKPPSTQTTGRGNGVSESF